MKYDLSFKKFFTYFSSIFKLIIQQKSSLGYDLTNTVSVSLLDKSLKHSLLSTDEFKVGGLVNMLQVDAQRLLSLCNYISNMVFLPLQLAFGLYLMHDAIGISFLFGVAVMFVMGLTNYCIGRFSLHYQKLQMGAKDERMKVTTEIFNAIKFIKANAWEEYFYDKLDNKRRIELKHISRKYICGTLSIFSLWITPMLIINATFAGYVWLGNLMDPGKAFTVISIFSILQEPIRSIPMVINYLIETFVSVKRIEYYLMQDDINKKFLIHDKLNTSNKPYAIKITNGNFFWRSPEENINESSNEQKKVPQINKEQDKDQKQINISEQKEDQSKKNKQSLLLKGEQYSPKVQKGNIKENMIESFVPVESVIEQDNSVARNDKFTQAGLNQNEQQNEINNTMPVQDSITNSNLNSTILFNEKLNKYIQNSELKSRLINTNETNLFDSTQIHTENQIQIKQQEQSFTPNCILKNLNITIPKGKLVAFIGDVGSGKSSLLYSLIGEMKFDENNEELMPLVEINGEISIVHQKPWILNATVRDNITFGLPFEEDKYQECVKYACLQTDFKVLGEGDQTQIGEKGVNLSGGQKARISLARSIYSNSTILLFDDILSAVDVHVGKSIVSECLLKYKKNTTRVLATHALSYLKYMDYIYFLKDGQILVEGEYKDIQLCSEFQQIYEKYMKDQFNNKQQGENNQFKKTEIDSIESSPENKENVVPNNQVLKLQSELLNKQSSSQNQNNKQNLSNQYKQQYQQNLRYQHSSTSEEEEEVVKEIVNEKEVILQQKQSFSDRSENEAANQGTEDENKDYLMLKEDRKKGNISWSVVSQFCKLNGGFFYVSSVLFTMTLWQGLKMASSVWISIWTNDNDASKNNFYLMVYSIFSISYGVFAMIRAGICLGGSVKQSRYVHRHIISALIFAPLNEFFERVPLGRILNILSKDLQVLDQEVGYSVGSFMVTAFSLVGDTGLCIYSSSLYVLIPVVLFLIVCRLLQKYYMTAQREVVRLETISRSPIISFFAETLNGLSSIRAYDQEERFLSKHCRNIDENKKCQLSFIGMESWFKQNLTFLSLFVNIAAISFCVRTQFLIQIFYIFYLFLHLKSTRGIF